MSDLDHASRMPDLHNLEQLASDPSHRDQRSGSGRQSSDAGSPSPRYARRDGDANEEEEDGEDSDVGHRQANGRTKRVHMQGRFSGRLETKQDEKRVHEECKLLGPLLGGSGKRGEKSRLTLPKIVRGIASGEVRKHCEQREAKIKELEETIAIQRSGGDLSKFLGDETQTTLLHRVRSAHTPPANASEQSSLEIPAPLRSPPPQVEQRSLSIPQAQAQQTNDPHALNDNAITLKAQAHNFEAHAHRLVEQSKGLHHAPAQAAHIEIQAQSFHAKAQSLERAAQAQNLQAQAVLYAHAQAEAQAQARACATQAENHGQAVQTIASQLKKLHDVKETFQQSGIAAQAQQIESEAQAHAKAQIDCSAQAQSLVHKAQVHAQAQSTAQVQAQQAALEAHHLDAQAKELQEKAHAMQAPPFSNVHHAPATLPGLNSHPEEAGLQATMQMPQLSMAETSMLGIAKPGPGVALPRQYYTFDMPNTANNLQQ